MGLFGKGKGGGLMNVIRCDETEYLVWKWRPLGQEVNSTSRENAIRYGSSLRVKDGEVAVFVYKQKNGPCQDFIVGPYDDTIKTANFPVLSSIVGMAFGGESPFQAEVYYINLQGSNQVRFAVPYFDVADPRLPDYPVPVAVRGTMTFALEDYKNFIKLNRLIDFSLDAFKRQIKDAVKKYVKGFITNIPSDNQIPVLQIERKVMEISDFIEQKLGTVFEKDFGVILKRLDLASIEPDKESEGYIELRKLTAGQQAKTIEAQTNINIKNMQDTQRINAENMEETMRIQREESQRAQRLQTETNFIGAHTINQQAEVLKTGAQNLGQMGSMDMGGNGGGSMNPAGIMTGMAMGGAMGQQMAGMMNQMGNALNGQQSGPFNMNQLQQLVQQGQLTPQTYVWKQGMTGWELAGKVPELGSLFQSTTPPPPPPPMP